MILFSTKRWSEIIIYLAWILFFEFSVICIFDSARSKFRLATISYEFWRTNFSFLILLKLLINCFQCIKSPTSSSSMIIIKLAENSSWGNSWGNYDINFASGLKITMRNLVWQFLVFLACFLSGTAYSQILPSWTTKSAYLGSTKYSPKFHGKEMR